MVRFCKNGEWVNVIVDDFIPCLESDRMPVFSRTTDNSLWVMIIEKAYAKLHGSYLALRGGFCHEALSDLTGCPTMHYDLQSETV